MENKYKYFKRDISWLSFNYRPLLEALDERRGHHWSGEIVVVQRP